VSAARELAKAAAAPGAAPRTLAAPPAAHAPALARRVAARVGHEWVPRLAWTMSRTGRPGLAGLALLLAAAAFLVSTLLPVAAEVEALRSDAAAARQRPAPRPAAAKIAVDPAVTLRALPGRADAPALLRQLFGEATRARLAIDTGKYEIAATKGSGVVRTQIAFPVVGPYPQIRAFLDATLSAMPAVALSDLTIVRRTIADGSVEAQLRMTVYTAPGAAGAPPRAASERASPDRVVQPAHAGALFAQHSWFVLKPAPPPAPEPPPPPPPAPTAPPLPYAFLGSFTPDGAPPVYFLSRGDRVIDAHVGDKLDGLYQLETADAAQLVFVYLPLNVRQSLAAGGSK